MSQNGKVQYFYHVGRVAGAKPFYIAVCKVRFSGSLPDKEGVLWTSVKSVWEKQSLRLFKRRPLSRQYIPQRSHRPKGITLLDIERGANQDLMSSQLLQIHIKDVPSNNFGYRVGKVDDRVGGRRPNNLGCPSATLWPKLCSILRPNFKVVPVHLLSLIIFTITKIHKVGSGPRLCCHI